MLFAKLLLSPMPHGRVRSIDAREALAMPGVKAILTADDLPAPADAHDRQRPGDSRQQAGERGLTMEPVYQGEPILAVCAVDELTAAEAIEKITSISSGCRFVVDPLVSLRAGRPERANRGQRLDAPGTTRPVPGPAATARRRQPRSRN